MNRLSFKLKCKRGVDVFVTHAPAKGHNDGEDLCHQGFECFRDFIANYNPQYFVHGHVHLNYGRSVPRESAIGNTKVINAYERVIIDIEPKHRKK